MLYRRKANLLKRISHILETLLLLLLTAVVNLVPFASLHTLAGFLVRLFRPFLKGSEKRIKENLAFAYPDLKGEALEKFIRNNLQHNIRVFLEVMQTRKFRKKSFAEKYLLTDEETVSAARDRGERGVVGIEGHFGNWELAIPFYVHHGLHPYFAAKRLANPYVDWILHRRRTRYGGQIIYVEDSEELVRQIRRGQFIGLVADQDASREGVFVNFFGRKASTFKGPALLALLGSARLILCTVTFQGRGRYQVKTRILSDKINRKNYASLEEGILQVTELWVSELEKEIRKNPEQYFWVHRRWKTRPPEERA